MSVYPSIPFPKETNQPTYELRFLEIEARLKNYEELLKNFESHDKQLNELKKNQVTTREKINAKLNIFNRERYLNGFKM